MELQAQHAMLRGMMDRCEELADELDAGRSGPTQLTREVVRLRLAFEAHNRFEEELLRPVLLSAMPAELIERLVAEHVADHFAMRRDLATTETAPLRAVIASMRAHLDIEESYMASAQMVAAPVSTE